MDRLSCDRGEFPWYMGHGDTLWLVNGAGGPGVVNLSLLGGGGFVRHVKGRGSETFGGLELKAFVIGNVGINESWDSF